VALVTASDVEKTIPGLTAANIDSDAIDEAEELIAIHCGYPPATPAARATMESTTYTRVITGRGGRDLIVDVWPVTAEGAIRDDPTQDWTDDAYLVDAGDYAVNEDGTGVRLTSTSTHGSWSTGEGQIRATWTAGYATAPPALRRAIVELVKHLLQRHKTQGASSTSSKAGSSSKKDEQHGIPVEIRSKLSSFRLPRTVL